MNFLGPLSPVAIYTPRNVNIRLFVNNNGVMHDSTGDSTHRSGYANEFYTQFGHILR